MIDLINKTNLQYKTLFHQIVFKKTLKQIEISLNYYNIIKTFSQKRKLAI
jgi:hypothetical protein